MAKKAVLGAGIALDGEAEFKKATAAITKDMVVLSSEMKKVTAEYDDNAYSMEALTAKSAVYNKQIETQKEKIDILRKALENSTTEYTAADSRTKEWAIKLNNAEAGLAKLNNELKANEANLTVMQGGLDKSGVKIGEASGQTSKYHDILTKVSDMTGVKIPAGMETFAVGAAAASAAIVVAFKAVAAIVTTVQANIEATSASVKELSRSSSEAQMGERQMAALNYAAELANTTTSALIDGFTKTTELIGQVSEGNTDAIGKFAALGITIRDDYTGELRSAQDVFFEIAAVLGRIEDQTARNSAATNLFGGEAKTMFGIFEDGGRTLREGVNAAYDEGIAKSEGYYEQLLKIAQQTDKVTARVNTLKSDAAIAWEEMKNGSDGFIDNMKNLSTFLWQFIPEPLAKIFLGTNGMDYDPYANDTPGSNFTSRYQSEKEVPELPVFLSTDDDKALYEDITKAVYETGEDTVEAITELEKREQESARRAAQFYAELPQAIKEGRGVILGSYASGTNYVPKTGLYELHEGEKVTPASQNRVVNNQPVINIYQPVSSPYETGRAVKKTMQQLIYDR